MTAGDAHARARWARRGDIALRVVASVPLAYATASLWAMALARLLPGDRAEATVTAALIALALCALAAMWAFAARSGWRSTYASTSTRWRVKNRKLRLSGVASRSRAP